MPKSIKYAWNDVHGEHYVRAWKERRNYAVQVWLNKTTPNGEPDGDWAYPAVLGLATVIAQAILDTKEDARSKEKTKASQK